MLQCTYYDDSRGVAHMDTTMSNRICDPTNPIYARELPSLGGLEISLYVTRDLRTLFIPYELPRYSYATR